MNHNKLQILTAREIEVLRQVIRGLMNKEIARALAITEKTVECHLGHIYRKLGVGNRTEAAVAGLRLGLED